MGKNPFQLAIGITALGLLFAVPALLGCNLHKSDASFVACTPWSDTVLWNRVWVGAAALMFAAYFWRRAIRSISSRPANPR
jgi:hypothetical protein